MNKNLDWGAALRVGWNAMKRNLGMFIILLVVMLLVQVVSDRLTHVLRHVLPLGLWKLPDLAVCAALNLVTVWVALRVLDGRPLGLGEIRHSGERLGSFLTVWFLYWLAVAVGLCIFLIPGIVLGVMLGFAPFLVLDSELPALAALQRSWELAKGALYDLILFWLVVLGVNLLGLMALGVGLFLTIPTTMVATAWVYRELARQTPVPEIPPTIG